MVILKQADAFLIKVDSTRKNYSRFKFDNQFGLPIFAEDVLLHNRFTLDTTSIQHNPDFSLVKQEDYIVVYCNALIPHSPNQIKFIFQVKTKIGNQVALKPFTTLKRGYPFAHIESLVEEGKLSPAFLNCKKEGYKIGKIAYSDLELLVNFDPLVRSYHSSSWKL